MWTLEYNGNQKTFEEWGLRSAKRTLLSLDVDTVTFEITSEFDAEDTFPADSELIFRRGETVWFRGRVDQTPRTATGRYESSAYVVVGPWWDIRDMTFQSRWRVLANPLDPDGGYVDQLRSHYILNMDNIGRAIYSTRIQIQSALQYVLDAAAATGRPAPFQFSLSDLDIPDFYPWLDEASDLRCEEIIRRQLRWTPDAVGFFDYSTNPPTFRLRQRASLVPKTLQFGDPPVAEVEIRPRHDLVVSEVVIKYEKYNVVNGVAYADLQVDAAPPGATGQARRALLQTISLEGNQISYSLSDIVCAPIEAASAEWWEGQYAPLADETVQDITVTEVTRSTDLPRYLVSGNITGWMLARNNATATRELIEAKADWKVKDEDATLHEIVEKPISTELIATDLTTGRYVSSLTIEVGDAVPVGLANYIYQSTSFLHYDGNIVLAEEECSQRVSVGDAVNITGAKAAYATMTAIVQAIQEDVETGRTSIQVGPPKHLGINDIIEFLKGGRNRRRFTSASVMQDGQSFASAPIDIGKETPVKNSNADAGKLDKVTVAGKLIIDKADNPNNKEVRLRELAYCDDGVEKRILVWSSAPY